MAGMRGDFSSFDVSSESPPTPASAATSIVSPKLSLIFGPWAKTEFYLNAGFGFHSNDARGTVITVDP